MEEIIDWFQGLKRDWPEDEEVIDKIVEGISDAGFDSKHIDTMIEDKLKAVEVEYKGEFIQVEDDEG